MFLWSSSGYLAQRFRVKKSFFNFYFCIIFTRFSALGRAIFDLTPSPPHLLGLLVTRQKPKFEKLEIMLACVPAQNDPLISKDLKYTHLSWSTRILQKTPSEVGFFSRLFELRLATTKKIFLSQHLSSIIKKPLCFRKKR